MPYNGSGVFNPATPPRQPNTTILSADYNSDVNDLSSGLSNAVTRDGQGAMSTQFKLIAGTVTVPGLGFSSATSSGIYMPSSNDMAFPVQGGEVMRLTLDGANRNVLIGATSSTGERLQVTGSTKLDGALNVTGASTFGGATTFNGAITLNGALNSDITIMKANPVFLAKATSGTALLDLDSATGQQAIVRNKKAGVVRWSTGIGGGNDDFEFVRYNTSGAVVDVPMRIEASGGRVVVNSLYSPGLIQSAGLIQGTSSLIANASGASIGQNPDASGSTALYLRTVGIGPTTATIYATNSTNSFTSWALSLRNGTNGNAFDVLRFNPATGTYLDNPLNINSATGWVTLNQTIVNTSLTVNGSSTVNGNMTATGNLNAAGGVITGASASINLNRTTSTGVNSVMFSSGGVGIWDYRSTSDSSAHLLLNRFDGSVWSSSLQINRLNGAITLYGPVTAVSTLHSNTGISSSGGITAAGNIGAASFSARNGSAGYVTLQTGGPATSGYVEFVSPSNVRQGYIGNSSTNVSDAGDISYVAGNHRFFGTPVFSSTAVGNITGTSGGAPWTGISGRPIIDYGNSSGTAWWTNVQGVITQTFQVTMTITGSATADTFTFPRSFPNACVNVQFQPVNSTGFSVITVTSLNQFAVSVRARDQSVGNTGPVTLLVMAMGI